MLLQSELYRACPISSPAAFVWLQLQKQRMSKFKFEPPQQQRRSIQNKHYDVTLMNTLQKCTQIIRQDRLFLRNQIINCNSEVVDTIRKYSKASRMYLSMLELQSLQVKLRKYLQSIKNKLKSQQLQSFKQTLRTNTAQPLPKRENQQLKSYMSPLRTDPDELNQTHSLKNYRSQDHYATTHQLNMNSSLKHFQELLKMKYSQEVIEERESENVTSARQARQEQERRPNPLHEQLFDSIENKIAGRLTKAYFPAKQSQNHPKEEKKQKYKQLTLKPLSWQFERKAKGTLYNAISNQKKQAEIAEKLRRQRINENSVGQSLENSIYYKHFNDSNHSALQNQSQSIANQHRLYHNSSIKSFAQQQLPKPEVELILAQHNRLESLRKSQQDIFTPLDLLNQCRNFIKQRENSNSKPIHIFTQDSQPQSEAAHHQEIVAHFNPTIPFNFNIETFLECLMEVTEMQPFISAQSLLKYINLHQSSQALKQIFRPYLQQHQQPHQTCLTKLANTLNAQYNSAHNTAYPHEDKLVASVYNLLDIDQKGFISQFDVTSFLQQLQTAEVHNFATVSQELWKLFNGADFTNEHQITYWHFYLIKESEEMARVKGLLDEFDFEIDRDDDE